ncbi:MAG TPA: sugar transferase [Anaerolineales bacterium]|nr:sugar transferase [Anaerolineales bacterium]
MSKHNPPATEERTGAFPRHDVLETAVYALLSVGFVGVLWLYLQRVSRDGGWLDLMGLLVLPALLTRSFERVIAGLPLRLAWRYRLAFLISAGVIAVQWLILRISRTPALEMIWLAPAVLGSFFGGLLTTALNETLWENNSPPSERIRQDVHQAHLEVIGLPRPAPLWKRFFDIFTAALGLVLFSPLWLACSFLIWFEDPGPLLFIKNSVGKGGLSFHQFKFRTMERAAERFTGPVMSGEADGRVLVVGRILRKTALDELPQLINILSGEMSFVGPRPQRTVLVRGYLEKMPEYAERHRVLPGLAGLAQVVGDYYLTPRQKLRFDRLYIQHASLAFDLKLILLAFLLAFWYRWQKGWNGRLPRGLVRFGRASRPR